MRKIYSLVLMTAMLLVGTNVWADDISVVYHNGTTDPATFNDLQSAINSVEAGDSATITLNNTITTSTAIVIPQVTGAISESNKSVKDRAPQRICLNLNGNTLQTTSDSTNLEGCLVLVKGTLHLTGVGTILRHENNASNPFLQSNILKSAITVCGVDGDKNNSANDRSKQKWSVLIIDEGVTVRSEVRGGIGIAIQDFGVNASGANGTNVDAYPSLDFNQYPTEKYKYDFIGSYSTLGYITYYKKQNESYAPCQFWSKNKLDKPNEGDMGAAFGVEIFVAGTVYGYQRGINMVGHVNQHPEDVPDEWNNYGTNTQTKINGPFYGYVHHYPYVQIARTGDVSCVATGIAGASTGGIYAGGWAIWDIRGTVHGQNGIYIKGGDVRITDAIVYSESPNGSANGNHYGTASGNGILIGSDKDYAGDINVNIGGDSKITGNGGAAIVDVLASNEDISKVNHVDITGGTIEGGKNGAINITDGTAQNTTLYGGSVVGTVDVAGTPSAASALTAEGTHVTTVVVDGKSTIVVSQGAAPTGYENVYGNAKDSVNWKHLDATTTPMTETLAGNLTLKELEINQNYNQTLTIPANITLSVEHVVLGPNAQIVVKPGAKFIVTGTQGIVAPKTSNIVLEASTDTQAQFLFNPNVTSNRHPNATVQLISDSYRVDASDRHNQHFGIPTSTHLDTIFLDNNTTRVAFWQYNYTLDNWEGIGSLNYLSDPLQMNKLQKPFGYYQFLCVDPNKNANHVITMKGDLVGNIDQPLEYLSNFYMGFANSYTADMDLMTILPTVPGVNKSVYVYMKDANGDYYWEPNTSIVHPVSKIAPMQAFIILNRGEAAGSTLDYQDMVWDPVMNPSPAPARTINYDAYAKIRVSRPGALDFVTLIQDENFTTDFDMGEAEKYMNDNVNIYVTDENLLGIFATNDMNNTYLGFNCKEAGTYTLTFTEISGEQYEIVDLYTNATVQMRQGTTYQFDAYANESNDYRFQIRKVANVVTDAETVEQVIDNNSGIYTITGQYVGNMSIWNTLPSGLYIVDGVKKVK